MEDLGIAPNWSGSITFKTAGPIWNFITKSSAILDMEGVKDIGRNCNPGQNSLAKCILFSYFPSHAHMSTLYKLFATLFPPPTSMLLFLIKSLAKKTVLPLTTLILGGGG